MTYRNFSVLSQGEEVELELSFGEAQESLRDRLREALSSQEEGAYRRVSTRGGPRARLKVTTRDLEAVDSMSEEALLASAWELQGELITFSAQD